MWEAPSLCSTQVSLFSSTRLQSKSNTIRTFLSILQL